MKKLILKDAQALLASEMEELKGGCGEVSCTACCSRDSGGGSVPIRTEPFEKAPGNNN